MSDNPAGRYPCDLHCHTVRSDGNDTPQELIDNAAQAGLYAMAITDHDVPPPVSLVFADGTQVGSVAYARERGVRLMLGYEFSCDTYVDDVHICGYGLAWEHPDLVAEVEAARRSKSEAYEELCRRLTAMGMPVEWQRDVLCYTDTKGHAATRSPDEVQRKHIFEAMAARGHARSWSEAKLMVRDNPELNVSRRKIDPRAAIELIHRCGGVAVLAHPYLIDEEVSVPGQPVRSRARYIETLLGGGLDGIEANYTYDKTTYKGLLTPEEIAARVRQDYQARVRFFSGGSDYHADHKKGVKKLRYLGERGVSVEEFQAGLGGLILSKE
jgi:predicted metal-dependent phosphoesterase TrpH